MGNKKIKILVDAHIFDHSFQGTATYILGLYSELVKFDDFEITICGEDIEMLQSLFKHPRFKFKKLEAKSSVSRLFNTYPRLMEENRFDYAHFQYILPFSRKTRYINTIHDILFLDYKDYFPWMYRFSRKILFGLSAKRSDILLTVSDYSRRKIAQYFRIDDKSIFVTPNAISISPKSEMNVLEKFRVRKYILFVSRFEPRKNQIGLLQAYKSLNLWKLGYDLVFIGSKKEKIELDYFDKLRSQVSADIEGNVHFFEKLDYKTLSAFYQQTSCFVFPSFAEGFGIPPIEAAINGCKVLCSNQTAMSDFDMFKYCFNPHVQVEFEQKLLEILADDDYPYQEIKEQVTDRYNWHNISSHFRDIILTHSQRTL